MKCSGLCPPQHNTPVSVVNILRQQVKLSIKHLIHDYVDLHLLEVVMNILPSAVKTPFPSFITQKWRWSQDNVLQLLALTGNTAFSVRALALIPHQPRKTFYFCQNMIFLMSSQSSITSSPPTLRKHVSSHILAGIRVIFLTF